ncbi:TerD family protein [Paenibacillus sp. UMB4589-SE434]|uniref:TerD family protein n=1 Tax=Paenibacillus sp. UMB4589-SE434 TaxID=3046314 RepID=UPI00254D90B5|nr:TerD family protein [Paenibacillus sp. UMB4589-SE434]MDK8183242.1 TerD family protein [Paenibacillus sp. UMB4589-SE434]
MSLALIKGQKVDLTKSNPGLDQIVVGMGWVNPKQVDIDLSAFLLSKDSKVTKDEDLVFYGNSTGGAGSVSVQSAAEKRSYSGIMDNEQFIIQLQQVPAVYERIAFTLTIHSDAHVSHQFSDIQELYIRILHPMTGNELIRYNLGQIFTVETAIVVGELYRHNGEWKFNGTGAGYAGGLAALCGSFGIEVQDQKPSASAGNSSGDRDDMNSQASVKPVPPAPLVQTPPVQPSPAPTPVNLTKIELKKRGEVVNLTKTKGPIGEIVVNLNWNRKKSSGFFGAKGVDLDVGCLYELTNGDKSTVQALGNSFGALQYAPYVALDGDDRTGMVKTGENLRINGQYLSQIKRILVYAFIYEGVANWAQADGIVTIKQPEGPDIIIKLDQPENRKGMCAIAMIRNVNNETFSIEKLVDYFPGHRDMDHAYDWGLQWRAGSK